MLAIAAKERAGKDIGSANTMAAQAKTAAEERLAKKDVRKAQRQMERVKAEKRRALSKIQRVVKRDAHKYAKKSKYAKKAKVEKKALKKEARRTAKLKRRLKEAHTGTTATTLLHRMYRPIPYEKACGSLAKDPKKLRQTSAKTVGACAAKYAALGKCRSFQFSSSLCTLSAKKIVKGSKYGEMLACSTRNVLITASMKLAKQPSVFQKKMELGEGYGFETRADKEMSAKAGARAEKTGLKSFGSKAKKAKAKKKVKKAKKALKKLAAKGGKAASNARKKLKKKLKKEEKKLSAKGGSSSESEAALLSCAKPAKVASLKAALRSCRAGIRKVSSKALESNQKLRAEAMRRGVKFKLEVKADMAKEKAKAGAVESRALSAERRQARGAIKQVKKLADERASKSGKGTQKAALHAKYVAAGALKKAMSFSPGEKKMLKGAKKMAKKLGSARVQSKARKIERKGLKIQLANAKVQDKADKARLGKKLGALEKEDAKARAKAAAIMQKKNDLKREAAIAKDAAVDMSMGLKMKLKKIKILKKKLTHFTTLFHIMKKKHRKVFLEVKKGKGQIKSCKRDKTAKLKKARLSYKKNVKKQKKIIELTSTQEQIAKRALQLCQTKAAGATGRAKARLKKRTNRAVHREKRKLKKKAKKRAMKKKVKMKVKAKLTKKLKKKEKKKVAKKVKKLEKKKVSPKCKACKKLSKEEHKLLGADCKACT